MTSRSIPGSQQVYLTDCLQRKQVRREGLDRETQRGSEGVEDGCFLSCLKLSSPQKAGMGDPANLVESITPSVVTATPAAVAGEMQGEEQVTGMYGRTGKLQGP